MCKMVGMRERREGSVFTKGTDLGENKRRRTKGKKREGSEQRSIHTGNDDDD